MQAVKSNKNTLFRVLIFLKVGRIVEWDYRSK